MAGHGFKGGGRKKHEKSRPQLLSSEGEDEAEDEAVVHLLQADGDSARLLAEDDEDMEQEANGSVLKAHGKAPAMPQESFLAITLQIFFPFLVAGLGMVGAGLVLDMVQVCRRLRKRVLVLKLLLFQHWQVFVTVSELFILVPALLGLKGNLEMTLASRLSTQANLGNMDKV